MRDCFRFKNGTDIRDAGRAGSVGDWADWLRGWDGWWVGSAADDGGVPAAFERVSLLVFGERPSRYRMGARRSVSAFTRAGAYCEDGGIPIADWVAVQAQSVYYGVTAGDLRGVGFTPSMVSPTRNAIERYGWFLDRAYRERGPTGADGTIHRGRVVRLRSLVHRAEGWVMDVASRTGGDWAAAAREVLAGDAWRCCDNLSRSERPAPAGRRLVALWGADVLVHAGCSASASAAVAICIRAGLDPYSVSTGGLYDRGEILRVAGGPCARDRVPIPTDDVEGCWWR